MYRDEDRDPGTSPDDIYVQTDPCWSAAWCEPSATIMAVRDDDDEDLIAVS